MPAPLRNSNASSHHLFVKDPLHKVTVATDIQPGEMAQLARDLGDSSLWIAERLTLELEARGGKAEAHKLIGLYAAVAHEMHQVAAEMEGETGIKAAPLGGLKDDHYERMIEQQSRSLGLILSQCKSAWVNLQEKVQFNGEKEGSEEVQRVLSNSDGEGIGVLKYLAGHIRAAKRMMRDLAANRAWKLGGEVDNDDLGTRIRKVIEQ